MTDDDKVFSRKKVTTIQHTLTYDSISARVRIVWQYFSISNDEYEVETHSDIFTW